MARDPHLHSVPQGRPGAPSWDATPLGAARLRRRPRRLPGHRLQRRRERRRVPPRGNPRRLRRGRMDRRAGLVRRQSGNDRRLVRRVHQRAGCRLGAASSGNDHPLEFHRRQVHGRLSLPWRGPTLLFRHRRIRLLHGWHERNAALPRVQRRPLGRALGAAPGAEQSRICSPGWPIRRTGITGGPAAFGAATTRSRPRRCSSAAGATATATPRSGRRST